MNIHILSEMIIQIVLIIAIAIAANRKQWILLTQIAIILGFHLLQTSFCFRFTVQFNHVMIAIYEIAIALQAYKKKNYFIYTIMAVGAMNHVAQIAGVNMPTGTLTCLNNKQQ